MLVLGGGGCILQPLKPGLEVGFILYKKIVDLWKGLAFNVVSDDNNPDLFATGRVAQRILVSFCDY